MTFSLEPNIISHAAEKSGKAMEAAKDQKYAQYENKAQQGKFVRPTGNWSFEWCVEDSEESRTAHVIVNW